jgi:putative ABC transport system ATP-binding protein
VVSGRALDERGPAELAELRRREVGYVFQRLNLVMALTGVENVMLPLELDGWAPRRARAAAIQALAAVGLDGPVDRYPDDFSGGQQQRIAIARAIVGERRLLLADEPTGALDTLTGDSVVELLATLSRERGMAIVLVTHDPRFASWADRVVSLRDGRIVEESVAPRTEAELAAVTAP